MKSSIFSSFKYTIELVDVNHLMIKHCHNDPTHETRISKNGVSIWYKNPEMENTWFCCKCLMNYIQKNVDKEEKVRRLIEGGRKTRFVKGKHNSIDTEFKKYEHSSPATEFKRGQLPWNYKLPATTETRLKISTALSNPQIKRRRGLKWTAEQRANITMNARHFSGELHAFYGKQHTEAAKQKMRDARLFVKPSFKDTKPELLIQQQLEDLQIGYDTHVGLYGKPDIFIQPNICIFADGDYYHCNPLKYKPDYYNKIRKKTAKDVWIYDRDVTDTLEEFGMVVVRLSETDINHNIMKCITKILGNIALVITR